MKFNDKQKIIVLIIALVCNFAFLATVGDKPVDQHQPNTCCHA